MDYNILEEVAAKYPDLLEWSVTDFNKSQDVNDSCKYPVENLTLRDVFPLGEFENVPRKNITIKNNLSEQHYEVLGLTLGIGFGLLALLVVYIRYKSNQSQRFLERNKVSESYKDSCHSKENSNQSVTTKRTVEGKGCKEFEVGKENFKLSDILLGSGAFGEVWKGIVIKDEVEVEVAAKTLKNSCPKTTLKSFLSEIKVMSYLGQHENLVGMVGAYTNELKMGNIIVFTELCGKGSLEKYLRDLDKALICKDESEVAEFDLNCLYRWCIEIANGMEYLSSKNVVHADLATRNVLLNNQLTAKVSDFGLSRKLYNYENYIKNQQEPLPWKWMSPESLKHLEFNEKTDVWAFGVTMWEIYSLGSTPYQGLHWTADFSTQLVKGLRMEKPLYDDGKIYGIIIKCWNVNPSKRPTFAELKRDICSMDGANPIS